ncbi:MAG: peroxiredoxin family protein [Deltaproteobacteria bacterium]|nr:peroxiredoxin family protein [Deltaproteobacteria bacterium]
MWQTYGDQGLAVLAISNQNIPTILGFGDDQGSTFPLIHEAATYEAYEDPGPGNYALEIVIDRDGNVAFAAHGSTVPELEDVIVPLLAE